MKRLPNPLRLFVAAIAASCSFGIADAATAPATNSPAATAPAATPVSHVRKLKAIDADSRSVTLNRTGVITLVVGTSEDSQDAARDAGKAVYPFQGRPDFQLIVVVDLRDSIATWLPSVVTARMRSSLDTEAVELKPYFLKNGNKSNPRYSNYVIPDFKGTVCPLLGWTDGSDSLRCIIFGVDGREVERIDKVDDMAKMQDEVKKAIQTQVDIEQAKLAAAAKTPGSKLLQTVYQHPPLVAYTPFQKKSE